MSKHAILHWDWGSMGRSDSREALQQSHKPTQQARIDIIQLRQGTSTPMFKQ